MACKQHLPDGLSPAQFIALQDALLTNANHLLEATLRTLNAANLPLAWSVAATRGEGRGA